jgi:DNA/RNA-binding domain of Phe-tRNA-synthetase-like protein
MGDREPPTRRLTMDDLFAATDAWRATFPGAVAGALVIRGAENPEQAAPLEAEKRKLEESLRAEVGRPGPDGAGSTVRERAYVDYYRRHGKTYHVKAQRESIALKGKPIPARAALVEAMFMAELKSLVLTAGHDLDSLELPVQVDVTHDGDAYVLMSGSERLVRAGDMMMADRVGIVSTLLYGPDERTRIRPETRNVLFASYAPAGVSEEAVRAHLDDVCANVLCFTPGGRVELMTTVVGG